MKKLLIFSYLILILSFGSGCFIQDAFVQDQQSGIATFIGVIEEQGASDSYSGTHLLVDGDKIITPLRSLSLNLSNAKYLGNKVEVIGILNTDDDVFEVTGITILEVLNSKSDATSFKEYKNAEFGISVGYYSDWEIIEAADRLAFLSPSKEVEKDKIEIAQIPYKPELNEKELADSSSALRKYIEENLASKSKNLDLYKKIGPDQIDTFFDENGLKADYYLYRQGLVYKISFIPSEKNYLPENKKVFNEMISSFRFIGFASEDSGNLDDDVSSESNTEVDSQAVPSSNSDYKLNSFENLPYKFAGKYPSDWYYSGSKVDEPNVLHHYGFSDESVTPDNEIITLDVLSSPIPSSQKLNDNRVADTYYEDKNGQFVIYRNIDGKTFRFKGPSAQKDLIIEMSAGIASVTGEQIPAE
ncbi:MAG: hypothetical protein WC806_03745 [Candidatus Gracilibacteria bacterium]|jgi:hypothetical protein